MSALNLEKLNQLLAEASERPWDRRYIDDSDFDAGMEIVSAGGLRVAEMEGADVETTLDFNLIVDAVNQLPALLDAFEQSLGLLADAADCLERYEDVQDGDEGRQIPNAAMSMRMSLDQFLARFPKEKA